MPVDLDELERLEREATPTDETRALVDEIESQRETIRDLLAALDDMIAELHTLRARVRRSADTPTHHLPRRPS